LDGILPISPSRVCILRRSQLACTTPHRTAPHGNRTAQRYGSTTASCSRKDIGEQERV
jgi:hypothetical protein